MAKEKTKEENPLRSGTFPPPPTTTAYSAPESTVETQVQETLHTMETRSAPGTAEELGKITVVLNEMQEEKIIALKVEYQRTTKKWLSDTELVRRLIESATLQNILTPSTQAREKQGKKTHP